MDFRSRIKGGNGAKWASMVTRAALASAAVVTAAVALSAAGPSLIGLLVTAVPRAYASALTWLRPPYLYLVINGIIISIAASSRFQKQQQTAADPPPVALSLLVVMPPASVQTQAEADNEGEVAEDKKEIVESRTVTVVETSTEHAAAEEVKPMVSTRFSHRKVAKPSPDDSNDRRWQNPVISGKALGVARRQRRNETLESTWRTITEGRAVPRWRHLKKSDTWNTGGSGEEESAATKAAAMRKTETFTEGAEAVLARSGGSRLRKERSVGQDELNRRVEVFIRKFNEEMRLQRQESLKNYMEMMNGASH